MTPTLAIGFLFFGLVTGVALLFAALLAVPSVFFVGWRSARDHAFLFFGIALTGSAVGFTGGLSREGVVGDLIPAALTILGGLSVYLFGMDKSRGLVATACSVAFVSSLLLSYLLSADLRRESDIQTMCAEIYSNPDILAHPEALKNADMFFGPTCAPIFSR